MDDIDKINVDLELDKRSAKLQGVNIGDENPKNAQPNYITDISPSYSRKKDLNLALLIISVVLVTAGFGFYFFSEDSLVEAVRATADITR